MSSFLNHKFFALLVTFSIIRGLFVISLYSQEINTSLERYSINDLAEGNDGSIWIATSGAIARYNGSVYKIFKEENSSNISNDHFHCIYPEYGHDRIWAGTVEGLTMIEDDVAQDVGKSFNSTVMAIAPYDNDGLILGSENGLYLFNKQTHKIESVFLNNEISFASHLIVCDETIWAATEDVIVILDKKFNLLKKYNFKKEKNVSITDICYYDNQIYVSTSSGLYSFTPTGNPLSLGKTLNELTSGVKIFRCIFDNHKGKMVVAVKGKGFYHYDKELDEIKRFWLSENLDDLFSLPLCITNEFIFSAENGQRLDVRAIDNGSNILLVPGFKTGEKVVRFHPSPFEPDDVLMVSTFGVFSLDVNTGEYNTIISNDNDKSHHFKQSFMDSNNGLWISDNDGYLSHYSISGLGYHLNDIYDVRIREVELWENKDGNICWANGNDIYSIINGKVTILSSTDILLSKHTYTAIDGDVYLFGEKGIFRHGDNNDTNTFTKLNCSRNDINVVYEDSMKRIWIGTESFGIIVLNAIDGSTTTIDHNNGLPEDTIMDIIGNGKDEVWVAQKHNLSKINIDNLAVTSYQNSFPTITTYQPSSGLFLIDKNGKEHFIFNSQRNGISISPDDITISNNTSPRLNLDYVYVNNNKRILEEKLILEPEDTKIAFNFSATQFQVGTQLNYAYWLEGYDKSWSIPSNKTRVDYSNLPKGHFVFHVKVQDINGEWDENEIEYPIYRKPAFFEKTGVRIMVLILCLLALSAIIMAINNFRKIQFKSKLSEAEKNISKKAYQDKIFFLSNVSHEYRTPLSMIYGPATMLLESKEIKGDNKALVNLIVKNSSRMLELTEKMMDFSKKDIELESLKVSNNDMSSAIRDISDGFRFMIEEKELSLSIDNNESESLFGYFDKEKIERTIGNLLSNSIKYTPKGGSISISSNKTIGKYIKSSYPDSDGFSDNEAFIEVVVKDSGIGVPQEQIDKIFQRFERVLQEVEDGNVPSGFGVGLNYILYLIKKHHGYIKYEPNVPWGSCFSFAIPSSKESYKENELVFDTFQIPEVINSSYSAPGLMTDEKDSEKHEILVVDDNPDIRQYLELILDDFCNVRKAANGDEALEFISQKSPEIVISDVLMPYMDGIQLCCEIKTNSNLCHIPVILLSAKNDVEDRLKGLRVGADAYIAKPFNPDVLKETLRGILRNRRLLQETLKDRTDINNVDEFIQQNIEAKDKEFLERMYALLEENISNEDYSLKQLASSINMSYSAFYQKVKALVGVSPQELLISYRLNKAMELLKEHRYNVSEVCYKVGFSSLPGFSRSFKNQFGVPPSAI